MRMQNLVQQNSFTKYKFITKTWKDNLRKGKKDKKEASRKEGRRKRRGKEKRQRGDERKEIQLSTTKVQKLTCPNGTKALLCNLIIKQSMLKYSALPPFPLISKR